MHQARAKPTAKQFEAPYNWCDRQCERCTVANTCRVVLFSERLRKHGEGDHTWNALLEDVRADQVTARVSPRQSADPRNIDVSVPPIRLDAEQLRRAGLRLVRCLGPLEDSAVIPEACTNKCVVLCLLFLGKAARVVSYLEARCAEAWDEDAIPNILLIELTLAQLRQILIELPVSQTAAALSALAELELLLAPLLASVDDAARLQLSELVQAGSAPSPFLVASIDAA